MLSSEYDVFDPHEFKELGEFPMPLDYDMPLEGLGGIGDFLKKTLNIGTAVATNYLGITQPQALQAPPQQLVAPSPTGQPAIAQIPQSTLQMPHMRAPYRVPQEPSFFEENAGLLLGFGGLAVILLVVNMRGRK